MKLVVTSPFHSSRLLSLCIAVMTTVMLLCSGFVESEDGWLYLSVSKNIYYRHVIESAPNEYPLQNVHMNTSQAPDGTWYATGSLGYSLAMVPAVALSDLTHHIFGLRASNHFPLEHDWTLHLFASFTNAFFAGLLAVILLLFLYDLTGRYRLSLAVSLLTVFTTNILPLAKNGFAHVMFTTFVLLTFFTARRFAITGKLKYLILSIISYGVAALTYNISYYLPIVPLIVYYILSSPASVRHRRTHIISVLALGVAIFKWKTLLAYTVFLTPDIKVFLEGMFGYLLSPGKSIFLYSPPLLLLPIFWHKLKRDSFPEVISFSLLAFLYIFLFSQAWIPFVNGDKAPIWHGGMNWGPRYIATLIPFGMILIAKILPTLRTKQVLFIWFPLIFFGIFVQTVAVSVPYILQYRDIPSPINIGRYELSVYDYASFIPRFTPLYTMSREFVMKIKGFKRTIDHGNFDVRLYDGFEVPHYFGHAPARGMRSEGHIEFSNKKSREVRSLFARFYNVSDLMEASASADVKLLLNDTVLHRLEIPPGKTQELTLKVPSALIRSGTNRLDLRADYPSTTSATQVVYLTQLVLNDENINLESLDYPEISTGSLATSPREYQYFGNRMQDPWKLWHLRARINERTFDFWWVKNLYYWDRPQRALWTGFGLLCAVSLLAWVFTLRERKK